MAQSGGQWALQSKAFIEAHLNTDDQQFASPHDIRSDCITLTPYLVLQFYNIWSIGEK
jgi:hypothetical protein